MLSKLKGKVLFVFSDPGGAKPILSLIEEINLYSCLAVSNRNYSFYDDFKTQVQILENDFEEIVNSYKPDLIFTGTSYPSDFDKQFLKIALEKNIECYTFVDHWTNIDLRFTYENNFLEPSQVWVIDENAKDIAMQAGIPENKIIISGNPYHKWLKNWKPKVSKEVFLKKIGLNNNTNKILLFAPDPLSNINGIEKYGFDEISITQQFISEINSQKDIYKSWKILIKPHPNQDIKKLTRILNDNESITILSSTIDANHLIYFSDLIFGFISSFLIEAKILGKKVIRFQSSINHNDPLSHYSGLIKINNVNQLTYELSR